MTTADRYLGATILGGRLHVDGIPEWGPLDSTQLDYWPEDHLDLILSVNGDRKVRTAEEPAAVISEPRGVTPTRRIWLHESLEGEARRLWESAGRLAR